MAKQSGSPLLIDVLAALGTVTVIETYLVDTDQDDPQRYYLHGKQQRGVVYVNPEPSVVDTLIHELIHEVRPTWSERQTTAATTRLRRRLTHDEIRAIYRVYQTRKKVQP